MTCADYVPRGCCAGLVIVRFARVLASRFCDGERPMWDHRWMGCERVVAECAHRIDESRELPACGWGYPHLDAKGVREAWGAEELRFRRAIFSGFRCVS